MAFSDQVDGARPGILSRARTFFAVLGGIYVLALLLMMIPFVQTNLIFLNALTWGAHFDTPELYGLAPGKTLNLKITTPDNHTIGAWFLLSGTDYHSLPFPPSSSVVEAHISEALRSRPTLLYLHGNSGTRANSVFVKQYIASTTQLQTNVLAIDYRGFGDSQGSPSEAGLATDSRAAFDWLVSHGAAPEDILIMGQSLGTAVASSLAVSLSEEAIRFRGLVLISGFASMYTLVDTYSIVGLFPLLRPLAMAPRVLKLYKTFLVHKFDALSIITRVKVPVLIAHAEDDFDIPHSHSETLFEAFVDPFLPLVDSPPRDPAMWTKEQWSTYQYQVAIRRETREELIVRTEIPHFGTMDTFTASNETVVLLKTLMGAHNDMGAMEGTQEVIRRLFSLG